MSLSELEQLRWQNSVLKEKNWASDPERKKRSEWFFLVNTRYKPEDDVDRSRCEAYIDEVMLEFSQEVKAGNIIALNRKTHRWDSQYIDDVRIRYAVELGKGKLKLDGTRGKSGGELHVHVLLTVFHHSNISLTWESLVAFFGPKFQLYFSKKPFVSRPRLTSENRTVEYMEKGFEHAEWKVIEQ